MPYSPLMNPAVARRRRAAHAGAPAGLLLLLALAVTPLALAVPPVAPATAPPASTAGVPPADATTPPAASAGTPAAAAAEHPDTRGLDTEVQGLKKDAVDLNKALFILQVAVFLSMDVGNFFALDSVQLRIDDKEVINYLYTPREVQALLKGGVQRLYLGNLKVGRHELVAYFNGQGPNDRPYKRGATIRFEKGVGAKYLELKIDDRQQKLQPEFVIKDWE